MGMRTAYAGELWVSYGQAYVQSTDEIPMFDVAFAGQANGLCGAGVPGALVLVTGLHTGRVGIAVEVHDSPPPFGAEWEEIVEVSFTPASPQVLLSGLGESGVEMRPLGLAAGDWRARYCATGVEAAASAPAPGDGEEPVGHHLLQFWPAPPAVDRVVRQTSNRAAHRHEWARTRAVPAPPPPLPEADRMREERRRLLAAGARLPSTPAPEPEDAQLREERLRLMAHAAPSARPRRRLRIPIGLARLDPDLAGKVAAAPPDVQRAIAVWAAHRACEVAGIAGLDWVAAGLDALDKGEPLPPPFDHMPDAFARLRGGTPAGREATRIITLDERALPPRRIDPRYAALPAIPAAVGDDPGRAAADALCAAAAAHGDNVQMLFDQVRYTFRLG